ncbi:MAG: class I SAM-dependent methyltransferase [Gemmatimonadales bacterium]
MADPALLTMGHNQRATDHNLGLGWLYYALARIVYPRRAVAIGSYRGFVPLMLAKGLADNEESGELLFIDPSMVDDFWKNADDTRAYFGRFGLNNVRHVLATTQQFVTMPEYGRMNEIGLLFIDGFHTAEQARFDYRAFEARLAPGGFALLHDSMILRRSELYGADQAYDIDVRYFIDELKQDPALQVLDVPYGTGLTLVRKAGSGNTEPLLIGRQARPTAG